MTEPTTAPPPAQDAAAPPAPAAPERTPTEGWSLRRVLRTETAETVALLAGDRRIGTVAVQYGRDTVEGVLALPGDLPADAVHGVLGWVTELLDLDTAAGAGGVIHWVVSTGSTEDFWRRSPGRRRTGAEDDLGAVTARIAAVLPAMFEEPLTLPDGGFAVDVGSVRVFVNARLVETVVAVRVFAITNVDVDPSPELATYLLRQNFTLALGRFSLDTERRAVWFDHVLTDVDDTTLARAVGAVAGTADRYDDEIKQRFGGRTFREEGSPIDALPAGGGMAGGYL